MFDEDSLYEELYKYQERKALFPLDIKVKRVQDCFLFDENDRKYLDTTACLDNIPLGYSKTDKETFFFHSSFASSELSLKLEKQLLSLTGLDKAYFTYSEENCYKILISLLNNILPKIKKTKIIASMSASKQNLLKDTGFETVFVPLNYDSIIKSVLTRDVGAVIIETLQLNNAIASADKKYLEYLRTLCDKSKIPLIFDTGHISPLRLGANLFNQYPEIKPDCLIVYKGISQGIPFGAVLTNEKLITDDDVKNVSGASSTAFRAVLNFLNEYNIGGIKESVSSNSGYFKKVLKELSDSHISLIDYEQLGFMYCADFEISSYELAKEALKEGLIINPLNEKTVLLTPHYYFNKNCADEFGSKLDKLLDKLARYDRLRN